MPEWWCCNCNLLRDLDVHGRCATCGSDEVCPATTGKQPSLDAELEKEAMLDDIGEYKVVWTPQPTPLTEGKNGDEA